jgi:hypothetical protein
VGRENEQEQLDKLAPEQKLHALPSLPIEKWKAERRKRGRGFDLLLNRRIVSSSFIDGFWIFNDDRLKRPLLVAKSRD